MIAQTHFINTC